MLETPRSILRDQHDGSTVMEYRTHKSKSIESSYQWYENEIMYQMKRGGLFEDPFMPATDSTVRPSSSKIRQYDWLRPTELSRSPQFVADGISRFDVKQGELGNCWVLAAVASLSMYPDLFSMVVPSGQSFDPRARQLPYVGMFWFRFWQFGEWIDVVVDDRLPTRNGRLIFMHSADRNEFWSALLEKAYAKLVLSYEALKGGSTAEAMEDFTGGLTELVDLGDKSPPNLFTVMEHAFARSSLMACSIDADPHETEADGPNGLILGHAYSVTDIRQFNISTSKSGNVKLVRLRNPWGNEREWTGPWGDQSSEWRDVPSSERKAIGLTFDSDGEFWMSFDDFKHYFSRLELCHLGPDSWSFGTRSTLQGTKRCWEMNREEGEWLRNSTAGGCTNFPATFYMNPQFRVQVIDPDETDDDECGTVIIGLMQKGMRERRQDPHVIGYSIFRMPRNAPPDQLLDKVFFMSNTSVARSPAFINLREVCGRHKLKPGHYVIVPSTFSPNEEAKFMIRVFSERACESNELDDVTKLADSAISGDPKAALEESLEVKLKGAFGTIAGPSGVITSSELRDILNAAFIKEFPFEGFSSETARSMVALMDADLNGYLSFEEFKKLWMELRLWKTIFKKFDLDRTGTLDAFELRTVMRAIGIHVSNRIYKAIACRYATRKGLILFDDYVLLLVRLGTVFETFKAQERLADGRAVFEAEDFIRSVIYI